MQKSLNQSVQWYAYWIEVSTNLEAVKTRKYLMEYAEHIGHNELIIDAGSGKSPNPYIHYFDAARIASFDLIKSGANCLFSVFVFFR